MRLKVIGFLYLAAMIAGGFSLARVSPEFQDLGIFGDVRYLMFYVLALITTAYAVAEKCRPANRRILWPWVALLIALHTYIALSVLWSVDVAEGYTRLPDIFLLMVTIAMAATIFDRRPQISTVFVLKVFFWVAPIVAGTGFLFLGRIEGDLSELGAGGIGVARLNGIAILAAIYLWSRKGHVSWLIPIPALVVSMFLSGSRTSVLALVVAFFFLSVRVNSWKGRVRIIPWAILGCITISWFLTLPVAKNAMQQFIASAWVGGEYSGFEIENLYLATRDVIYLDAWRIFRENPLIGIGLGSYIGPFGEVYPHNLFLNVAVDSGLVGVLLFVAIIGMIARRFFQPMLAEQYIAFCIGVFLFVLMMFAGTYYDARLMWLFFTLYLMTDNSKAVRMAAYGESQVDTPHILVTSGGDR